MKKDIDKWYKTMWLTRGCRFNAYTRVKRVYNWSSVSIIMFSIYIIGINLLMFTDSYSSPSSQVNITIVNIVLSTFILALSVYLNGRDFKSEFQGFHNCGKDIAHVYNRISSIRNNEKWDHDITPLIEEYEQIIKSSEYNHSNVDYEKMTFDNQEDEKEKKYSLRIWYLYYVDPILIYLLLIVIPPILLWVLMK